MTHGKYIAINRSPGAFRSEISCCCLQATDTIDKTNRYVCSLVRLQHCMWSVLWPLSRRWQQTSGLCSPGVWCLTLVVGWQKGHPAGKNVVLQWISKLHIGPHGLTRRNFEKMANKTKKSKVLVVAAVVKVVMVDNYIYIIYITWWRRIWPDLHPQQGHWEFPFESSKIPDNCHCYKVTFLTWNQAKSILLHKNVLILY